MVFAIVLLIVVVWLAFGYIGARACLLDFRNNFGEHAVPTGLVLTIFLVGPVGYAVAFICADREALYEAHWREVPETKPAKNVNKFFKVN